MRHPAAPQRLVYCLKNVLGVSCHIINTGFRLSQHTSTSALSGRRQPQRTTLDAEHTTSTTTTTTTTTASRTQYVPVRKYTSRFYSSFTTGNSPPSRRGCWDAVLAPQDEWGAPFYLALPCCSSMRAF